MHRTRLFLFKISTIHVIFFSAGRSHLPTELCRPVQILFLTSYKLNKIFKNIKVVLVKDRKGKRLSFPGFRQGHTGWPSETKRSYLSGASAFVGNCPGLNSISLHFIPNLAINNSLLCLKLVSTVFMRERFLHRTHNSRNFDSQCISTPKFSRFFHASRWGSCPFRLWWKHPSRSTILSKTNILT